MDSLARLQESKEAFLALVADLRPELHRYCARMTGSVADGEDIVQDALAKAYYALPELEEMPDLRKWLFAIAHRRAIDHLRRYDRRFAEPFEDDLESPAVNPEDRLAAEQSARLAIGRFCELPAAQRSVVILKDVLGHSVAEIAMLLDLGEAAVKSLLHRGRGGLRARGATSPAPVSPLLERYAALFNAHDWDGVRALLADDVKLDLVARVQRNGKREVAMYFTNYASKTDFYFVPARIDGRPALAVYRHPDDPEASYLVELTVHDGYVLHIRDYRYVPYIMQEAVVEVQGERSISM